MSASLFRSAFALITLVAVASVAPAQTNYQWNSPASDFWSSAAIGVWTPTGPVVPGADNTVTFNAGGVAVQDVAAMQLNSIILANSTGTGLFVVPTTQSLTLVNSTAAVGPTLNQTGSTTAIFQQAISTVSGQTLTLGGNGTGSVYLLNGYAALGGATINKTGPGRVILLGGSTGTPTLTTVSGGILEFYGVGTVGGAAPITLDGGAVQFGVNSTGNSVNRFMTIGANGGEVIIPDINFGVNYAAGGNVLRGSGTLTKSGPGNIQYTGANANFSGAVIINGGGLVLNDPNTLGPNTVTAPLTVNSGGSLVFTTGANTAFTGLAGRGSLSVGGVGPVTATTVNNGTVGGGALNSSGTAANVTNTLGNNITLTSNANINVSGTGHVFQLDGAISGSGFGISVDGGATVRLTAVNTFTGPANVVQATLALRDGGILSTPTINVGAFPFTSNGQFTLDHGGTNPTLNRLSSVNATLNLRAGTVNFLGNVTQTSTTTIPNLNLDSGAGAISVVPGATASAQLTINNLTRGTDRGTLFVRSNSLGAALGNNVGQIIASNLASLPAGDFVGTGLGTDLANVQAPILRWAGAGNSTTSTAYIDFVTYGANGLTPLAAGQYDSLTSLTPTSTGNNVRLTAAATQTDSVAVNSLNANGFNLTQNDGMTLRVESGAIISNGSAITVGPNAGLNNVSFLEFADREAIVSGSTTTINSFVNSRNGFTRGSSQVGNSVIFGTPNAITGPITLNSNGIVTSTGFIQVANENSLGAMSNPLVFGGGTLNYFAPGTTWNRDITVRESGGNFGVGSATQAANQYFDAGPYVKLTGDLTSSGMFIKGGGGVLELAGNNTITNSIRLAAGLLKINSDLGPDARIAILGTQGRQSTNNLSPINPVLWVGNFTFTGTLSTGQFGPQSGSSTVIDSRPTISVDAGATFVQAGPMVTNVSFVKNGPGTMAIESATQLGGANVFVSGAPGLYQNNSIGSTLILRNNGTMFTLGTLRVEGGATAILDNTAVNRDDRLRRNATLQMNGGTFRLVGNNSEFTYQHVGTLNLVSQQGSRLEVQPGTNAHAAMHFGTITRGVGSPLTVAATNLGTVPGPGVASVFVTSVPAAELLGGGGAAGTTNRSILRGMIGDQTVAGFGTSFVTYDPRFGVKLLDTATEYAGTFTDGAVSTDNVRMVGGTASATGPTTVNSLTLTGGATITGASTLTPTSGNIASLGGNNVVAPGISFGAAQGYIFLNGGKLTLNGPITGSGGLGVTGAPGSVLELTAINSNTFTGTFTIDRVTVAADQNTLGGISGALPDISAALIIENGGVLRALNTGVALTPGTARTVFIGQGGGTYDNAGFATAWDIGISGIGKFTKTGIGELTYNSSALAGLRFATGSSFGGGGGITGNFFGGINVAEGHFAVLGTDVLFPGAPIDIASGATFRLAAANGVGSIAGTGTIDLGSGPGAITVGSQYSLLPSSTFAGNITGTSPGGLTKGGLGTLTLNPGATLSDFTGGVTINAGLIAVGGNVLSGSPSVLGSGSSAIIIGALSGAEYAGIVTSAPATIDRDINIRVNASGLAIVGTQSTGVSSFGAGRTLSVGALTTAAKTIQFTAPAGGSFEVNGLMIRDSSHTGVITIDKSGEGRVVFANGNTPIDARVVLSQGELVIADNGTLTNGPIGTGPLMINGGTLSARGPGSRIISNVVHVNGDFAIGGLDVAPLTLAGPVSLGAVGSFLTGEVGRTITANSDATFANTVTGAAGFGALVKAGPGMLTLSNSNSYAGGTTVAAGVLRVTNSTGSGTGTGPVRVQANATLAGNGFIGGATTVLANGIVAPGTSIGTLTVNNDANLNTSSVYQWDINGYTPTPATFNSGGSTSLTNHDQLAVAGVFTGGDFTLRINELGLPTFTVGDTYSWTIATGTGIPSIGTVNIDLANAPTMVAFGGLAQLILSTNAGQVNLNFTPVPEPATILALSAGAFATAGLIRRRFKKSVTV